MKTARTLGRLPLLLMICIALAACGGGTNSSNDTSALAIPPHNIVVTQTDPTGDASASAGVAWDITQVQSTLVEGPFRNEYVKLQVAISFLQDVSSALPAPGQPLANNPGRLGVEILINKDGTNATGISEAACSPTPNIGSIDAFVDAGGYNGRNADGSYPILDTSGLKIGDAPVNISGHTITYSIDLAALGSPATGIPKTQIYVIAFNGYGEGGIETDCAPNGGPLSVSGS